MAPVKLTRKKPARKNNKKSEYFKRGRTSEKKPVTSHAADEASVCQSSTEPTPAKKLKCLVQSSSVSGDDTSLPEPKRRPGCSSSSAGKKEPEKSEKSKPREQIGRRSAKDKASIGKSIDKKSVSEKEECSNVPVSQNLRVRIPKIDEVKSVGLSKNVDVDESTSTRRTPAKRTRSVTATSAVKANKSKSGKSIADLKRGTVSAIKSASARNCGEKRTSNPSGSQRRKGADCVLDNNIDGSTGEKESTVYGFKRTTSKVGVSNKSRETESVDNNDESHDDDGVESKDDDTDEESSDLTSADDSAADSNYAPPSPVSKRRRRENAAGPSRQKRPTQNYSDTDDSSSDSDGDSLYPSKQGGDFERSPTKWRQIKVISSKKPTIKKMRSVGGALSTSTRRPTSRAWPKKAGAMDLPTSSNADQLRGVDCEDSGSSDDDTGDWEEVRDADTTENRKSVEITVEVPHGKTKKKFDFHAYMKAKINRYRRYMHGNVHKIHLLCLLARCRLLNSACSDDLLRAVALSMFQHSKTSSTTLTLKNLSKVVEGFRLAVACSPTPEDVDGGAGYSPPVINTKTIVNSLVERFGHRTAEGTNQLTMMFVAVARVIGLDVRLLHSVNPAPVRMEDFHKQMEFAKSGLKKPPPPKPRKNKAGKKVQPIAIKSNPYPPGIEHTELVSAEVYLKKEARWINITFVKDKVHIDDKTQFEKEATYPFSYVFATDNEGAVKDLTSHYTSGWMTTTPKLRTDDVWLKATLAPYASTDLAREEEEDRQVSDMMERKPLPTALSEFKSHPLYALERHLLKFETFYPRNPAPLGYIRGEPVYSRECVHTLHSRETWLKEAKSIKKDEEPYKIVQGRRKPTKHGVVSLERPLPVFGKWQIEDYIPPVAKDGIVPRNQFGNVELFKPCMLPGGTVQLRAPNINKAARKLNIDCVQAMVGWGGHGGWSVPVFDGWVVCKEHEEVLLAASAELQIEIDRKSQEKREKKVLGNWKLLVRGLRIRERLKKRYNLTEKPAVPTDGEEETVAAGDMAWPLSDTVVGRRNHLPKGGDQEETL